MFLRCFPYCVEKEGRILVKDGLAITFQALNESRNLAVGEVLAFAYENNDPQIRQYAIESILKFPRGQCGTRVVETWHELGPDLQVTVLKAPRALTNSIRVALRSDIRQTVENGLELTATISEPQLIPELLRLAENDRCALRPQAASTLATVVESMVSDSKGSGQPSHTFDHRSTIKDQVIECIEKSVKRFAQHRSTEIIEAFLMLVDCSNQYLSKCLMSPRDMAMAAIVKVLVENTRPTIVHGLLVEFLAQSNSPPTVVRVWSQRNDSSFIEAFCIKVGRFPTEVIRRNLKRLKSIRWLKGSLSHLAELNENQQIAVSQILRLASLDSNDVFRVLEFLMLHGALKVKQRAAELVCDIRTPAADRLVSRFVEHEDPTIQSIMLGQMREREIPGAVGLLVKALDSEHPQVQATARRCFPDVAIDRYLASFDSLDEESQKSSGELMLKIDAKAIPKLADELSNGNRNRRLRAVHVVETLGLVEQLDENVADVLEEDDYYVRLEAVRVLGRCRSSFSRRVLRDAMMDPSTKVRLAAEKALQGMARIPESESPFDGESDVATSSSK